MGPPHKSAVFRSVVNEIGLLISFTNRLLSIIHPNMGYIDYEAATFFKIAWNHINFELMRTAERGNIFSLYFHKSVNLAWVISPVAEDSTQLNILLKLIYTLLTDC